MTNTLNVVSDTQPLLHFVGENLQYAEDWSGVEEIVNGDSIASVSAVTFSPAAGAPDASGQTFSGNLVLFTISSTNGAKTYVAGTYTLSLFVTFASGAVR